MVLSQDTKRRNLWQRRALLQEGMLRTCCMAFLSLSLHPLNMLNSYKACALAQESLVLQGRIGQFVVKDKMILGHESAG